jgi:hypothetical protein
VKGKGKGEKRMLNVNKLKALSEERVANVASCFMSDRLETNRQNYGRCGIPLVYLRVNIEEENNGYVVFE